MQIATYFNETDQSSFLERDAGLSHEENKIGSQCLFETIPKI